MRFLLAAFDENDFKVPKTDLSSGSIDNLFQIVFAISGSIALIILMIASLKYITSRGDPQGVAKAKNTILYALVGLAISAAAFSIVGFVVKSI